MKTGIGVKCDSEKCKNASEKSLVHKPIDIFSSGKLQVIDQLLIFLKTRYVTNPGKRIVLLCFLEFVTRRKLKKTMHSFFFLHLQGTQSFDVLSNDKNVRYHSGLSWLQR